MQSLTDVSRLTGRYTTVTTTSGVVGGTILAAGTGGLSVSVDANVRRFAAHEIVSVTARG